MIAKSDPNGPDGNPENIPVLTEKPKGEQTDMQIDKSKLSPEELAALEAIEKKAGIPQDPTPAPLPSAAPPAIEGEDDIYKGIHPEVKAELERLRKQADAAEERDLMEIAKKYEIIGKKPDELVPMFKSLKASGDDAYNSMIAVLDASVAAVEKSGLFAEIGKRGAGENDAWASIERHASEIQKSAPNLTWNQAIDKACDQHPELVHEYESKR